MSGGIERKCAVAEVSCFIFFSLSLFFCIYNYGIKKCLLSFISKKKQKKNGGFEIDNHSHSNGAIQAEQRITEKKCFWMKSLPPIRFDSINLNLNGIMDAWSFGWHMIMMIIPRKSFVFTIVFCALLFAFIRCYFFFFFLFSYISPSPCTLNSVIPFWEGTYMLVICTSQYSFSFQQRTKLRKNEYEKYKRLNVT